MLVNLLDRRVCVHGRLKLLPKTRPRLYVARKGFQLDGWEFVGAMVLWEGSVVVARLIVDIETDSLESIARAAL